MNPMPDHEAALWAHELAPSDPTLLINALAPDPYDVGALLRAAIDARRLVTGESDAELAARCIGPSGRPLHRAALSRAAQPGSDARPGTVRAVCRALGLRVALVPVRVPRHRVRLAKCGACNSCIQGAPCEEPVEVD